MILTPGGGISCTCVYLILTRPTRRPVRSMERSQVLTGKLRSERTYRSPVLLAGRPLECLMNNHYRSGGHLIHSYPDRTPNPTDKNLTPKAPCRYSIVFVLQAHAPVPVNTDELTTLITGNFTRPMKGVIAGDLFKNIQAVQFNSTAGLEKRDEQKKKLAETKVKQGLGW